MTQYYSEHHILVKKTARYYISGEINDKTKVVLFALHGFGQLARNFISEFDDLAKSGVVVIAPEGLSRSNFGRASDSRIGASWMSKEDRLNEIDDYVEYLDTLYNEITKGYSVDLKQEIKIYLLGFSQGGSTALRWFVNGNSTFNELYICSSDIAKDVDPDKFRSKSQNSNIYYVYGKNDASYSRKNFSDSADFLKENKIRFSEKIFDGVHEINKDMIKKLINE
ncbi:esterase [soil metagenome]